MKWFSIIITAMILTISCLSTAAWPVVSNPEVIAKSMMEIPQWHCLRYFKHDVHLMRRCRNYRLPMLRRPDDANF